MTGSWDAEITLLYPAEAGHHTPVRVIPAGSPFDVIAVVRVGQSLMQVVNRYELFVFVRNLSRSTTLLTGHESQPLEPRRTALADELAVGFSAGWTARQGDVLDVLTTFAVTAGVNTDYSVAESPRFVVC